jgi:Galactose-3-O-sulfotransferase
MSEPLVTFIHLPKTAGVTVSAILRGQYTDVERLERDKVGDDARALRVRSGGSARAVAGHMPYGLHKVLSRPCAYLTVLRDPVQRIASHYHWVSRHPSSPRHAELVSNRMSISDYVQWHSAARAFNNGQTRLLGREWFDYDDPATEETLEAAKRNLERFVCVGLMDRFDESVLMMRRKLGWSWPTYQPRNVAPAQDPIDAETRETILRYNRLDVELCRWARERFDREAERLGAALAADLRAFRAMNPDRSEAVPAAGEVLARG